MTVTVTFQNVLQAVHKIDVRNVTHNYEHVTPNELTLVRDILSYCNRASYKLYCMI